MKTAIITICDNNNYGNRLQNYALQEILKQITNSEVITIWNETFYTKKSTEAKKKLKDIINLLLQKKLTIREFKFKKFTNQYINATKKLYTGNIKIDDSYSQYVIGSDQIWNYMFRGSNFGNFEFAMFANQKNIISYAASFGVSELSKEVYNTYISGLSHLNQISVREKSGSIITKNLIGKEAMVVLDPTLLLDTSVWNQLIKKPRHLKTSKYILMYFLGNLDNDKKILIEEFALTNDCIIINVLDQSSEYYKCDPSEFLYLEKNAFLICTDSYHSTIFSFVFNRPFVIFERNDTHLNMNSRLETLLNLFKLNDHKFNNSLTQDNLKHDYTNSYKILELEREKSLNFLKKHLYINEKKES